MTRRYPDDCSASCSKIATWDFTYVNPPTGFGETKTTMSACDDHKDQIHRAAETMAFRGEVTVTPHQKQGRQGRS